MWFRAEGSGLRAEGSGLRAEGSGFGASRGQGLGFVGFLGVQVGYRVRECQLKVAQREGI